MCHMKGYQSRHNKLQWGFPIERCRWVCDLLGEHWMKIGRLFAALKKDLPGLALHYVCIEGSCLLFWLALYDGWHKKSCHTNVLCKNGIDSISLSCCSGSTYKMVWLFMSFFAKAKSSIQDYFYIRSTSCPLFFIMDSKFVQMTLLFFLSKGLVCTRCR